ncbi:hypothetical protein [Paenibacillus sanfengchensis]|uniref:hypothetical protein n=1 Tax=Paenibacillus sanfengchensis TaxID=3119819 RepID=UPI002FE1F9C9
MSMRPEEALQFDNWILMDDDKKIAWLKSLEGWNGQAFRFKSVETVERDGRKWSTGLFDLNGSEFIFVPGGPVTLGWDRLDERDASTGIIAAIEAELEVAGVPQKAEAYLRSVLSPRREVRISPMLVERNIVLMESEDGGLVNYYEVIRGFEQAGFSLPTEDEWEYMCGGGTSRIFGDHIDQELLKDICQDKRYYYTSNLERPNAFGLYIAYDPYICELVLSPIRAKGGDGGGAAHGGYYILGVLPLSPHYKDETFEELMMCGAGDFDCDVYARRVVRLAA